MEDCDIIALFFERSEHAITRLDTRYGAAVRAVVRNILSNTQDAEECVDDAYMELWSTIPPKQPERLGSYVCAVARNTALRRCRSVTAQKRNSYYDAALDELEGTLASSSVVGSECEAKELAEYINKFLDTLPYDDRYIFVRRYWYCDPVRNIAESMELSAHAVSVRLFRVRSRLKKYLRKEGLIS